MNEGWIKLYRKLTDNPLWKCEKFTRGQAWVDLILLANHEYGYFYLRNHKIEVQRGQVGWSQLKLSERWKWSRNKVKKFLNDMEKEQQVIQQQSKSTSIITIVNYETYQQKGQQVLQQQDNSRTTEEQQQDTNKKNKNEKTVKNDKKKKKSFVPPSLDEWISYFEEKGYKKDIAKKSWDYYHIADWHDSKGNKVKNWKQKAISVWFKDENKILADQNAWIDKKLKDMKHN